MSEKYELKELSEGYRKYILLISDILLRVYIYGETPTSVRGIILIDEFDNHLHPDWQNGIVDKLSEVFPNIQFILTTYNPMSILDREANQIINLEVKERKINLGTKNIDISTILLKYFKVDSLVGKGMQKDLKKFRDLKLKNELSNDEKIEFEKLKDKFSESVATNFLYNNAYFEFLKFIKNNPEIEFKIDDLNDLDDEELNELLSDFEESL